MKKSFVTPEKGALVITNRSNFFICASLGEIRAGEKIYHAISIRRPIFKAMQGKMKGDHFSYSGLSYRIQEII